MYEPRKSGPAPDRGEPGPGPGPGPGPDQVIAWLKGGSTVDQALQTALGGMASERDSTLARMGEVLQAAAQGLRPEAAATWAGVSASVLRSWMETDPAFAAAFHGAAALAAAHGVGPGKEDTPAMLRALLVAIGNGATLPEAIGLAGLRHNRFQARAKNSPALAALLDAARRVRPSPRGRGAYLPAAYRPRRPDKKVRTRSGFRLIQRTGTDEGPD
ncbi:hypothetical protein [Streptomyces sp. NPDC002104]